MSGATTIDQNAQVFATPSEVALGGRGRHAEAYCGPALEQLNHITFELTNIFNDAGFQPIEPTSLQAADPLFALYGEEIWERAVMVESAGSPPLCLRPDFTVPVAQAFLNDPTAPASARYGYFGPVFRRSLDDADDAGALQRLQAGIEIIGEGDAPGRDAEVFDLATKALRWCGCQDFEVTTGDLGVMFSLIDALAMPGPWRRRLKRHFWKPEKFQQTLQRFAGLLTDLSPGRRALLHGIGALDTHAARAAITEAMELAEAPHLGVRSSDEIAERLLRQAADVQATPLPRDTIDLIEETARVRGAYAPSLTRLQSIFRNAEIDMAPALNRMIARQDALDAIEGVDVYTLAFDATFGRNLQYYDGFVFEMRARALGPDGVSWVKLGGGGRYDRLFRALGAPAAIDGVGVALNPEAIMAAASFEAAEQRSD